jgi:hypothetical protein
MRNWTRLDRGTSQSTRATTNSTAVSRIENDPTSAFHKVHKQRRIQNNSTIARRIENNSTAGPRIHNISTAALRKVRGQRQIWEECPGLFQAGDRPRLNPNQTTNMSKRSPLRPSDLTPKTKQRTAAGFPRVPQFRFTLAGDFARRRDLGANGTAMGVDRDDTDCAARAGRSHRSTRQTRQQ